MTLVMRAPEAMSAPGDAPFLPITDPIESPGSLLLVEPGNPNTPWAAGVPDNGALVPNLFAEKARTIVGNGSLDDFALTVVKSSGFKDALASAERTAKGGLHGILTQSAYTSGTLALALQVQQALGEHMLFSGHPLYVSVWGRITRANIATADPLVPLSSLSRYDGGQKGAFAVNAMSGNNSIPSGGNLLGSRPGTAGTLGAFLANRAGQPNSTGQWSNYTSYIAPRAAGGFWGIDTSISSTYANKLHSWILYRTYVEDLTVSGRTYAEVDALDYALYEKHVLTADGRYYGDTYTDPATLP